MKKFANVLNRLTSGMRIEPLQASQGMSRQGSMSLCRPTRSCLVKEACSFLDNNNQVHVNIPNVAVVLAISVFTNVVEVCQNVACIAAHSLHVQWPFIHTAYMYCSHSYT